MVEILKAESINRNMRGRCGKAHFTHKSSQWNRLPQKAVQPPSLETTKTRLDKALSILLWPESLIYLKDVALETFWGPFQLGLSYMESVRKIVLIQKIP